MSRYRPYLIGIAIVLVLVCAYAAAGFFAVPYFVRKAAVGFVRTHYGRTLALGEVRCNPFTLALDVRGLALPDADGRTLLAFEHLRVRLQLASIWRLGPSFAEILLERPYVRALLRPGGELNFADLARGFPPSKPQPQPAPPPRLYVQRLAVVGGTAVYEDRTRSTPFRAELTPIVFELRDFSTRAATGDAYSLEAASPEGERLLWTGTVHLAPFASRGAFEVSELKAATIARYLGASLPFDLTSGTLAFNGGYEVAGGAGPIDVSLNVRSTTVRALGLRPRGATRNYIEVAGIAIEDMLIGLRRHAVTIGKVTLKGGDIEAWLDEAHRLNLLELFAPASAAQVAPARPQPVWTLSVPEVLAEGFRVSLEDRSLSPAAAVTLTPLTVHVTGFNLSPDDTLELRIESGVSPGGNIACHAHVLRRTAAVDAQLEAHDLPLTLLQPYLTRYTSMTLLKGTLGTKLDIRRGDDGVLAVSGTTAVHDVRTIDDALKLDFLKWRDLRIAELRYRSAPASLRIASVTALEPYVRMVIAPDRSTNLKAVLTPSRSGVPPATAGSASVATDTRAPAPPPAGRRRANGTAPAAAPARPLTPLPVSIGTVTLVNGSANYSDLWIKPSFAIGIQSLAGRITGLSSDPQSRARVQLEGKVDRYAPWKLAGEVNLLSAALFTDLTMSFSDVDLTVVNPYSGHFVGYRIEKGKLSVDVHYQVEQRRLTAAQHFVIDQLELGERVESPDAVHVPLKIAVALLRDRNGVIDLNLPMSGSLDDPQFRLGPIIWKAFVNVLEKAAAAPFALLGHLFGGGNTQLNIIEFDAGSAELTKPAQDQLASLATALKERPQLKLDVPIVFAPGIDAPALAAGRLRDELQRRELATRQGRKHPDTALELALAEPRKHFELLLAQYQADFGRDKPLPPSVLGVQQAKNKDSAPYDAAIEDLNAALIDRVQVPESDLEALGTQRAQAIQGALVSAGEVDSSRVFVVNAPAKPQSGDTVKVELAVR
ncbi:MAG TPA: DUF748 domain-containing protein [Steroidobacteraceae bacterium]|nr:DUF748 domain-containing protein [Steroidobacteraceae bacterium]